MVARRVALAGVLSSKNLGLVAL